MNREDTLWDAISNVIRKSQITIPQFLAWYMYYFSDDNNITMDRIGAKFTNNCVPEIKSPDERKLEDIPLKEFDKLVDDQLNEFFGVEDLDVPDDYWLHPENYSKEFKENLLQKDMELQGYTEEEKKLRHKIVDNNYMKGQTRERIRQHIQSINDKIKDEMLRIESEEYNGRYKYGKF